MQTSGMTKTEAPAEFTRGDRRRLARALATAHLARDYRRLEAVLLVAEGASVTAAARQVRVARRSVQRWVARYQATGDPAALADAPRSGRRPVAPALTAAPLEAALALDPRTIGFRATTWTVPLLVTYLAEHQDIVVSARTLRRRLQALGYRWKRPRYTYAHRAAHLGQKKGLSSAA